MITREHLISDEALAAPLQLADHFLSAKKAAFELVATMKKMEPAAKSASPSKLKKATDETAAAQRELKKIQEQTIKVQQRQSAEYIAAAKALKAEQDALKRKIQLGQEDAKTVNAQNSSITRLKAALDANRKSYSELTTAEERNSASGRELLNVITQQDTEYKQLKVSMGQSQDNVGNYEGAMRGLKEEFKAARDQMTAMAMQFGTESQQFIVASQRAGLLKGQISDINDAVRNTQASKIENLTQQFSMMGSELKSGDFAGAAMSARQFAETFKGTSVKEIVAGLGGIGAAFASIGKALLKNPIFLVAAALAAVGVALYQLHSNAQRQSLEIIARYDKERAAMALRYEQEIKLQAALGQSTEELERRKLEAIVSSIEKQLKAKNHVITWYGAKRVKLSKEEEEALLKQREDAINELQILDAKANAKAQERYDFEREQMIKKFDHEINLREAAGERTEEIERRKLNTIVKSIDAQMQAMRAINLLSKEKENELLDIRREAVNQLQIINVKASAQQKRLDESEAQRVFDLKQREKNNLINFETTKKNKIVSIQETLADEYSVILKRMADDQRKSMDRQRENDRRHAAFNFEMQRRAKERIFQLEVQNNQATVALVGTTGNAISQLRSKRYMEEIEGLQRQKEAELLLAGTNAQAREQIEMSFNGKIEDLQRQNAAAQTRNGLFQRAMAIASIWINTRAAMAAAVAPPPIGLGKFGIKLIPLIKANGILQAAAVAATVIPEFASGTDSAPGGLAVVGEEGRELVKTPSNKYFLTPPSASVADLEKGSKVFTAEETLATLAKGSFIETQQSAMDYMMLGKIFRDATDRSAAKIVSAIAASKPDIVRHGSLIYQVEKRADGTKKRIRKSIMTS